MDSEGIEKAKEILAQDKKVVPQFWQEKYKTEAHNNWQVCRIHSIQLVYLLVILNGYVVHG
jgi:hypothetical protein